MLEVGLQPWVKLGINVREVPGRERHRKKVNPRTTYTSHGPAANCKALSLPRGVGGRLHCGIQLEGLWKKTN